MVPFTHLHVHSQYSILDGAASVGGLVNKAKQDGMTAIALTDHGTMFGIKEFHETCKKQGIKPILGVETYVASRGIHFKDKNEKEDRSGDHLILLAKNKQGYGNLLKLVTIANTEGMYYKPRIDKELLARHSEGLIVSSACLGGEIPQLIMKGDMKGAREAILWYKSLFGEDYYLELQRHPASDPELRREVYESQQLVNKEIIQLAKELEVKLIATNDVHFVNREDADAHDLLICLNTGKDLDDPTRLRYTKEEWLKSTGEMNQLFADMPEVLATTVEIAEKVDFYELNASPIMPEFPIPETFNTIQYYVDHFTVDQLREEFGNAYDRLGGFDKALRIKFESDYLQSLVYKGAAERYGDPLEPEIKERIDFELDVIKTMGFPGYFLIVQDFINAARQMGVIVGPGRGSAAGSVVAYTTGITNVDPIRYALLFERFLNPDRISMPDIDIDFDDDGRQLVLDWVKEKYGRDRVAHICPFGTMAAKMAIRDVGRVLRLPLPETDRIAKMVPETPKITLKDAYKANPLLEKEKTSFNPLIVKMLEFAGTLEGCVRQFGVHACGVIIGRESLDRHIPLMPTKDEDLLTTQYDGHYVESIGLLKMDFLGLKTLSIIKECLENIKLTRKITLDIDRIPMDDAKTFELFSNAETTAIFQFESAGMKKWLKQLQSNCFEDLVAMNALYRPGPMDYIPSYINRKHGREEVVYDHPMMEEFLKDTYGITVYQEQVMLQSRALANFTRGQSDSLRKAMGKKDKNMMDDLKLKFQEGCKQNPKFMEGCRKIGKQADPLIDKIWKDWESFASYAFNKSHSVCYAFIAYQTGYLKAHYPSEFMAAVLSCNLSNSDKISLFMDECNHMGMKVLGPDINESRSSFFVNKSGALRFGLTAIKGVGAGAVADILKERDTNGDFKSIYDLVERVNLQSTNKKNLEGLAMAGAFDSFQSHTRSQFFADMGDGVTFLEALIRYGNKIQSEKGAAMANLFGDIQPISIKLPTPPAIPEWPTIVALEKEKNLIGIYLSAHPLDEYRMEIDSYCTKGINLTDLSNDLPSYKNRDLVIAGIVTEATDAISKSGKNFATMVLTDYNGSMKMMLFGSDYVSFGRYCKKGLFLLVKGRVSERWNNSTELEFKPNKIELLEELAARAETIDLELSLDKVEEEHLEELIRMVDNSPGKTTLRFTVVDPESDMQVRMFSRIKGVTLTQELKSYLQNHSFFGISLN
ncbi:MAG: DNA polymerase III subunit alpha [Marinilabiliales bacterium]|nr:DNA polymerase III subunit alpha [Marinilabiliales bacterium]